jgi:hypothetical protein
MGVGTGVVQVPGICHSGTGGVVQVLGKYHSAAWRCCSHVAQLLSSVHKPLPSEQGGAVSC